MNSFSPSVAVVGLGGFARTHLTLLSSLQAADCCNIVAIADPFANHDEDVVCAFEQSGTRLFSSLEKLLGEVQPEAVFIATPIHLHEQQTVAALNAGCHVYVEKPPCATLAEWHRMKAAQDNANRRCEVGFLLQSSSSMQFLRRKLCEGVIGKVQQVWTGVRWSRNDNYYARSSWAGHWQIDDTPVFDGPATNALAHAVQAALGLAASTPSTMPIVRQARGAIWRARPIESYDTAFLDIETTDDVAIRLVFTHATSFSDEVVMRVKGEQGTAAITWNGQVTLHPEGKEEQQFKFLQQPALSAFASFLQSIAHTEHVTQTPLEHTLPFMQAISSMSQSSSGIHNFPSQKVSRREECYQVSDLDEEIQDFQNDFDKIPKSLLLPQAKWIEPENLSPDLPPLNQTNNHGHE